MYIITSPATDITPKRAIYYSPNVGRHRMYRSNAQHPHKRLRLLAFKSEKRAQATADEINERLKDDFVIELHEA